MAWILILLAIFMAIYFGGMILWAIITKHYESHYRNFNPMVAAIYREDLRHLWAWPILFYRDLQGVGR